MSRAARRLEGTIPIRITDIVWDTDGESVDLPTEVEIYAEAEDISDPQAEVADWLSDKYGWCVNGFSVEPASPTP